MPARLKGLRQWLVPVEACRKISLIAQQVALMVFLTSLLGSEENKGARGGLRVPEGPEGA